MDEEYHISLRLRDSPYVLPLHGLVRATRWNVLSEDPIAHRVVVLDVFLVLFVESPSGLFHDGEWTVYEKEILAMALIDALYDIESRGVSPTNADAYTVRLTLDGSKSIEAFLSCIRRTGIALRSLAKAEILGTLSTVICHLFTEERPDLSSMDDENLPSVFRDIVRHAMGMQTVAQLRQEMWEELQEIRERGVTVLDLVRKRHLRFERQVSSKNTWWSGMDDQEVPWWPDFHQKAKVSRSYVPISV